MYKVLVLTLILQAILFSTATAQNIVVSADLSAKRALAEGFVNAINSRSEKFLSDFITANFTVESLKQRPVEQRLSFLKQVANDMQGAPVKRIAVVDDNQINAIAQSAAGEWFIFGFTFDEHPPLNFFPNIRTKKRPKRSP